MNHLRSNEQDEGVERNLYTCNLIQGSFCTETVNLALSFLASKRKKETGWVSLFLSDKANQFFMREKVSEFLSYKSTLLNMNSYIRNIIYISIFVT